MRKLGVLVGIFVLCPVAVSAQLLNVKIIQRQNGETQYTYQVAGHSTSTGSGNANCYSSGDTVNCNSSSSTNTSTTAPQMISYSVAGATYSLLLPDGRVAVVNCTSKFAEHFAGPAGNKRSCRMPIVDKLQAEFKGKNAKLIWPVSLDGKKMESETYTILGILPAS
ncbi:hypothetical protein EDE15_4935 [Edaphobacter aggregans]|uniref:Uncharacterized protein n=1 Tax=Edaphobacter aggregans TaxID=570835 RepID=A0A3R9PDH4_9BACT|nr:hypothetical protein EDE15_4935 [Edaphobacter aggregans]